MFCENLLFLLHTSLKDNISGDCFSFCKWRLSLISNFDHQFLKNHKNRFGKPLKDFRNDDGVLVICKQYCNLLIRPFLKSSET